MYTYALSDQNGIEHLQRVGKAFIYAFVCIFFWLQTQSLNSVHDSQSANKNYRASAIGLTLWKK